MKNKKGVAPLIIGIGIAIILLIAMLFPLKFGAVYVNTKVTTPYERAQSTIYLFALRQTQRTATVGQGYCIVDITLNELKVADAYAGTGKWTTKQLQESSPTLIETPNCNVAFYPFGTYDKIPL